MSNYQDSLIEHLQTEKARWKSVASKMYDLGKEGYWTDALAIYEEEVMIDMYKV
jgi:hypothetical protein